MITNIRKLTNIRINTKIRKHINYIRTFVYFRIFVCLLVFVLSSIFVLSSEAKAATLYFYPQSIDVFEGENIVLEVRLNTEGETINALEVNGGLINNNITVESVDTSNSLVQIFIEPPQTDSKKFRFIGGTPGGFNGEGIIGRLNLTASEIGINNISFSEPIKVFANTEEGKELPIKLMNGSFSVTQKPNDYIKLSSRTHPTQVNWYNSKEVNIHWDLESGAEYSYLVSQDQTAAPDDVPDKPEGDKLWLGDIALTGLGDGIYYFTVKKIGSKTVSRYSIFQDATLPEWVSVALNAGTLETDNKSFVSFLAKDSTSGIDYYEIKIDEGNFEKDSPPNYIVNKPDFRRIVVRAYDKAGNFIEESIETKRGDYSLWIGAAFVVFVVMLIFIVIQRRKP